MPKTERKSSRIEKVAKILKAADVVGIAYGLIIGGLAGFSLIFLSASTYYIADKIGKRAKTK